MNSTKTVSFIGAGNVATHLAKALYKNNFLIKQVFSKSFKNANSLAKKVNAQPIDLLTQLSPNAEIYIIAVPDDAIEKVLKQIPCKNKLVVHTSGSVGVDVFSKNGFSNFGIFYPLQTFSKNKIVDFTKVPFCLEANTKTNLKSIEAVAKYLSDKIYPINSEQRQLLHLAAVFACNFSNNMYQIAYDICNKNSIDFDILKPLIKETASKIEKYNPLEVQTGPAKRNDKKTIQKHLSLLENQKNYQEIYRLITQNILQLEVDSLQLTVHSPQKKQTKNLKP